MSQVFVAATLDNGTVGLVGFVVFGRGVLPSGAVPSRDPAIWFREPTPENIAAEVARTYANPTYTEKPVSWRIVDDIAPFLDRDFRNALADTGTALTHDLGKARVLRMAALRHEREMLFPQLDAQWMRAQGQKKAKEADDIEARRQALRDMPVTLAPTLDACTTIEELRAIQLPE